MACVALLMSGLLAIIRANNVSSASVVLISKRPVFMCDCLQQKNIVDKLLKKALCTDAVRTWYGQNLTGGIFMQMKAQVFETVSGTFKDDKQNDMPYHQLQVMDLGAPVKEVINLKVKPELFEIAKQAINKVCIITCSFSAKAGKMSFHSFEPVKA